MKKIQKVKLSDYKPFGFEIPEIYLDFRIRNNLVEVISSMHIIPLPEVDLPLILKGIDIKINKIEIDDIEIDSEMYSVTNEELTILYPKESCFKLTIFSTINPFSNSSLEGLYSSGEILTSQCEAEGFRRICYHPDRPDILSKFRVRIEAKIDDYPVLLSNGNKIKHSKILDDDLRHEFVWDDPFPKPSYLFALVAGKLVDVRDTFITSSGKPVDIAIYVEDGDQKYTKHAMNSIKRSMKWDEEIYGLEYDLNQFNVVAIRHFNMGAMENKGLNIFNSKLILADSETTTDAELERIESVIAHEYFHNWSGNRVTCRDWFQLSLKEGLTVFRDQSFTSDLHSRSLKRIEDVSLLRSVQFSEDSGPTSHAVKPNEYSSIDNFYTTTIYEKGAELIRMLKILLGDEIFFSGTKAYFKNFDGCAATTEDYVNSIFQEAIKNNLNIGFDINQFLLWYYQSGTPIISIERFWIPEENKLRLRFKQIFDSVNKKPLVIPIKFSLILNKSSREEQLLVITQKEQSLEFSNLPSSQKIPLISVFRDFSAPVKWETDLSIDETLDLVNYDNDLFSIWDAFQNLMKRSIILRAYYLADEELDQKLINTITNLIDRFKSKNPSFLASLLTIPSLEELQISKELVNPISLYESHEYLNSLIATSLFNPLYELSNQYSDQFDSQWPNGQGERKLIEVIWRILIFSGDLNIRKFLLNKVRSNSMTIARAALNSLQACDCVERKGAMEWFYNRWKNNSVVLDVWFTLEASMPRINALSHTQKLLQHARFDPIAPNSVRAVLGGFSRNVKAFHSIDGSGYMFLAEQIKLVDCRNPITASRLSKIFSRWRNYKELNRMQMYNAINYLNKTKLSSNTREVVDLMMQ